MNVKTIMMADDDAEDIELFKDVLVDLAFDLSLDIAVDGRELMLKLEEASNLPDIIFLDLNMPFKNGMLCLEEIKANVRWKDIKVIILSTSSHQEQMKAAYDKGADFYMVKLSNYVDFKNAILACLEKKWQTME